MLAIRCYDSRLQALLESGEVMAMDAKLNFDDNAGYDTDFDINLTHLASLASTTAVATAPCFVGSTTRFNASC